MPLVTNPKSATNLGDLDTALETWETNKRLFEIAGGKLPDAEQERLAFIGIRPGDISPNMIMEMAKPGFVTSAEVRMYTLRLVKMLQHQKRRGRNLNLVDAYQQGPVGTEEFDDSGDQEYNVVQAEFEHDLAEIYSLGLQPAEQAIELNALMNKRFVRSGPPRGRSVPPPQRGAGFRGQPLRSASAPVRTPPRERADVQCVNCNRKGHTAQDCRQQKVDKFQRKYMLCD